MDRVFEKDGLSRNLRNKNTKEGNKLTIINSELDHYVEKAMRYAEQIYFFNSQNKKDGYFNEVFNKTPYWHIITLRQIRLKELEQKFLAITTSYKNKSQEERNIILKLIALYETWYTQGNFQSNFTNTQFKTEVLNQIILNLREPVNQYLSNTKLQVKDFKSPSLSSIWDVKDSQTDCPIPSHKIMFHKLSNSIYALQQNAHLFEKEIIESGNNDPAFALIIAFLKNHNLVIDKFNSKWNDLPHFYHKHILNSKTLAPEPDHSFIKITKQANRSFLSIPKDTTFATSDNILFKTKTPLEVTNSTLKKVFILNQIKDHDIEPATQLNYITQLKKRDISSLIDREPSDSKYTTSLLKKSKGLSHSIHNELGIQINSWTLLLREGKRKIVLKFETTQESGAILDQLINDIALLHELPYTHTAHKILDNIFIVSISSAEGWQILSDVIIKWESDKTHHKILSIYINITNEFPSIDSVYNEKNDSFGPPAIRLSLNPQAWLFPYSWLKAFNIKRITIDTQATDISNIQVYSELGKLDTTMQFMPFGPIPKKGAWVAIGAYEMTRKAIQAFDLNIKWKEVPNNELGFTDYYKHYHQEINNRSFKVVPQQLVAKKWTSQINNTEQCLFSTSINHTNQYTKTNAALAINSRIRIVGNTHTHPIKMNEADYRLDMFTSRGFYKLLLQQPTMGFGNSQFQKIISNMLKLNAKAKLEMPNPPFIPEIEQLNISYSSSDTIDMASIDKSQHNIQHHATFGLQNVPYNKGLLPFLPQLQDTSMLLFGIEQPQSNEILKLFIELAPSNKKTSDFPEVLWYYGNGITWIPFKKKSILRDGTRNFFETGIIELKLPYELPIKESCINQLFWIKAGVNKHSENISEIISLTLHVVEVERILNDNATFQRINLGQINTSTNHIPGMDKVIQLCNSIGGRLPENEEQKYKRLSGRMSHKNRAINSYDYERIVLEHFPTIEKVKCFPGIDSNGNRPGIVTLAIIESPHKNDMTPLSNCKLLLDIEKHIKQFTPMFATVEVINPKYEFVQVRCMVTLGESRSKGHYLRLLNQEINDEIAFWNKTKEAPVFGRNISINSIANFIKRRPYVRRIDNFSIIHIYAEDEDHYISEELETYDESALRGIGQRHEKEIHPSKPWGILIPQAKHILLTPESEMSETSGLDELEVGKSFIIR